MVRLEKTFEHKLLAYYFAMFLSIAEVFTATNYVISWYTRSKLMTTLGTNFLQIKSSRRAEETYKGNNENLIASLHL